MISISVGRRSVLVAENMKLSCAKASVPSEIQVLDKGICRQKVFRVSVIIGRPPPIQSSRQQPLVIGFRVQARSDVVARDKEGPPYLICILSIGIFGASNIYRQYLLKRR
jgi:hypothetical protein